LQELEHSQEEIITKEFKEQFQLFDVALPFLEVEEGVISGTPNILKYLCRNSQSILYNNNNFFLTIIDQWIELFTQIKKKVKVVSQAIFGKGEYTPKLFFTAQNEIKDFIKFIDSYLKKEGSVYLVNNKKSIADYYGVESLSLFFQLILDTNQRKTFAHITKWFSTITSEAHYVSHMGKVKVAEVSMKVLMESKKEEQKVEVKKEPKAKAAAEPPQKKEVNPLDLLPPSSFDLDKFKYGFLNAQDKRVYLREHFWRFFDKTGWSIWLMLYEKAEGEGVKYSYTKNLVGGFLQVIISLFCFISSRGVIPLEDMALGYMAFLERNPIWKLGPFICGEESIMLLL
jgi:elongation factor 1-gamma